MGRQTEQAGAGDSAAPDDERAIGERTPADEGATDGTVGGATDGGTLVDVQAALIASLPSGAVFVVDHALRYQFADGEALYAAGLRPSDLVGRTIFEALAPALAESYAPMYRRALAGETFAHEHAAHGRVFVSRGGPLRDATGAVKGALAVSYDITDRRLAEDALEASEARQAFLLTLTDALRPLGDAVEIQGETARLLREQFAAGWAYYVEFDETQTHITVSQDSVRDGLPSMVGHHPFDDMPEFLAEWQAGRLICVDDFHASSLLSQRAKDRYLAAGINSFLGVPVLKRGVLIAALILADTRQRPWSQLAVDLTVDSAERTWAAVERARAEAALRASEARLRLALEVAELGTWTWELDTGAGTLDARGAEIVGLSPGRVANVADAQRAVIHPDDIARVEAAAAEGVASGGAFDLAYRVVDRDGRVRHVASRARVSADAAGGGARLVGTSRDATAEREGAAERERLLADTEAANRAKSDFLATMSHEIRTPINAILGYGELLDLGLAGPVTEQQRDYLVRLRTSGQHLSTLVSDVLDLAKVDAGQMPVAREHALTGEAVGAALAIVLPLAQAKGVDLRDGQPGDPGVAYVGDAHRVRQILVNLLSNAVKFTPAGGTVTVVCGPEAHGPPEARLTGTGPWARIEAADTGIGIAPEHHAAIFDPFVQAEPGRTRTAGGTGLGLAISRRLARLMGGDLVLERSAPGAGSVFTLWLPAASQTGGGGDVALESAAARGARASREVAGYRVHGLGEVGAHLRAHIEEVLETFVARLRGDPAIPMARSRDRAELEDHTTTLLGNLAQSLVIIEHEGGLESDLLKDGGEIQRVVADLHGRQRRRLGWTEPAFAREYAVLTEEVVALVRRRVPEGAGDVDTALDVLRRLLGRAGESSLRAFRHAPAPAAP